MNDEVKHALGKMREKLLDLTRRNRLLNFTFTAQAIRVVDELPDEVFRLLVGDEKPMGFLPMFVDRPTVEARQLAPKVDYEMPGAGLRVAARHLDLNLQTALEPERLEKQCGKIGQAARSAIEEMGINILYLAIGFLEWKEAAHSEVKNIAPLLLVPVSLERVDPDRGGHYRFEIAYTGEDIETNASLAEKLKRDHGLVLPEFDEETTPETYMAAVRAIIPESLGWSVLRQISLGMFSFTKLRMFRDLDPAAWPNNGLAGHPTVVKLLAGDSAPEPNPRDPDGLIDRLEHVRAIPLVLDADSSQQLALFHALHPVSGREGAGRSLVIEGPPGTGKSQTITNLIAAALAAGKSVLFVSEKAAALDVVRQRLENLGLSDFCLDLHSTRSQRTALMASLKSRRTTSYPQPPDIAKRRRELDETRERLVAAANTVMQPFGPWQEPARDVLWKARRFEDALPPNAPRFEVPVNITAVQVEDAATGLDLLGEYLEGGVREAVARWRGFRPSGLLPGDDEDVRALIAKSAGDLERLQRARASLGDAPVPNTMTAMDQLAAASALYASVPPAADGARVSRLLAHRAGLTSLLEAAKRIHHAASAVDGVVQEMSDADLATVEALLADWGGRGGKDVRLEAIPGIARAADRAASLLAELMAYNQQQVAIRPSMTWVAVSSIADVRKLAKIVAMVAVAPEAAREVAWRGHVHSRARAILEACRSEAEALGSTYDSLKENLRMDELPSPDALREVASDIELHQGTWFPCLSAPLKAARAEAARLVWSSALAHRPQIVRMLREAADYTASVARLRDDDDARAVLGPSYQGITTPWSKLATSINWAQTLRQALPAGVDAAAVLASRLQHGDWWSSYARFLEETLASFDRAVAQGVPAAPGAAVAKGPTIGAAVLVGFDGGGDVAGGSGNTSVNENGPAATEITRLTDLAAAARALAVPLNVLMRVKPQMTATDAATKVRTARGLLRDRRRVCQDKLMLGVVPPDAPTAAVLGEAARLQETAAWVDKVAASPLDEGLRRWLLANPRERATQLLQVVEATAQERTTLVELVESVGNLGVLTAAVWLGGPPESVDLAVAMRRLQQLQGACGDLLDVSKYVAAAAALERGGFGGILNVLESGHVPARSGRAILFARLYRSVVRDLFQRFPAVQKVDDKTYGKLREQFTALDGEVLRLNARAVAAAAAMRSPPIGRTTGRVAELTEVGLLDHEMDKTRRFVPLRQLVARSAGALAALKPCFMMSPLSVAQYLRPGAVTFDLVVMDEASQLRPEDALGAIARARQVVVVGDPMQLPPTDFFRQMEGGPEDDQVVAADSESILDVCSRVMPRRRLRWHYRSEHESLIAFSNREFYNNDLLVFPSPRGPASNLGVSSRYVEGIYTPSTGRAGNRNEIEAEHVANAVIDHLVSGSTDSLGVVTFNAFQRDLIEELVDRRAQQDPRAVKALERLQRSERFFVKNLENVQGDERDVIFISTTFGPQEPGGKPHQRFGPLTGAYGHRRLNVLITRAKRRVVVFTSMRPTDVLAGETAAWGVRAFRGYLEYAATGMVRDRGVRTGREADSPFEEAVSRALADLGVEAVPQVGVAGFFIDIGVVHPARPGEFLLGIECDGATYHSSRSVRDRDRLRQQILERLGWRIHRIWSTDWFMNREAEVQRLRKVVEQALGDTPPPAPPQPPPSPSPPRVSTTGPATTRAPAPPAATTTRATPPRPAPDRSAEALARALRAYRDANLKPAPAEMHRCLLRDEMVEVLVRAKPTSLDEFYGAVPQSMRENIDGAHMRLVEEVFEIILDFT